MSNVEVFTDKSGRSKGTAMVQFEDPGSAHDAIGILLSLCVRARVRVLVCVCDVTMFICVCLCFMHTVRTYVTLNQLSALFHGQMLQDRPMIVKMVRNYLQCTYVSIDV